MNQPLSQVSVPLADDVLARAAVPVFLADQTGRLIYANEAGIVALELGTEDLGSIRVGEAMPDLAGASWDRLRDELAVRFGNEFETIFHTRLGRHFPALVAVNEVLCDAGPCYAFFVRDIRRRKQAELRLQKSEESLRAVFNGVNDAIFVHDATGAILDVNDQMLELYGVSRAEACLFSIASDYTAPGQAVERLPEYWRRVLDGEAVTFDWKARRPHDGSVFDVEVFLRALPTATGRRLIIGVVRDVSVTREAERSLRLHARVFENALEGICITDADSVILAVNPAFTTITGYGQEEVVGKTPRLLKSKRHGPEFYQEMWRRLTAEGRFEGEIWNRRKDGEAYPEWISISAIRDDAGRITNYVAVFHDITELKRVEERIRHLAYHDPLTSLPNRALLKDRIATALAMCRRRKMKLAVLFIDLDNFKTVNDTLGHEAGDLLLKIAADRLMQAVRQEDTVARLGGDEFVVMLHEMEEMDDAVRAAQRIIANIAEPFDLRGREGLVSASIGIAVFPEDGPDPETLLGHADLAMYRSKKEGKNTFHLYTPEMNEEAQRRLRTEAELAQAIRDGKFRLYYQPRVDLRTMRVSGIEALLRWDRDGEGQLKPDRFLKSAEESGLILPLGEFVMAAACAKGQELRQAGWPDLVISVNVSPHQVEHSNMGRTVRDALKDSGLPSRNLEIEIREASVLDETPRFRTFLEDMAEMGVAVSIDEFGGVCSSFATLKRHAVSTLKIAGSFIEGIPSNPEDLAIVTSIISIGRGLDLKVVAKNVERSEQLNFLLGMRCREVQGILFSPPLSPDDLLDYLRRGPAA